MTEDKPGHVLRLMTGPDGQWPVPVPLDDAPVTIRYLDFKDRIRTWRAAPIRLRQGGATVMLEIRRDGEAHDIPLKLHRIMDISDGPTTWPGHSYVTDRLGVAVKWTKGPRDAGIPPTGPLAGQRVAITGDFERLDYWEMRSAITDSGGICVGKVDESTTLLVIGSNVRPRSTKLRNAKRVGTAIRTEDEFLNLINDGQA